MVPGAAAMAVTHPGDDNEDDKGADNNEEDGREDCRGLDRVSEMILSAPAISLISLVNSAI